MYDTLVARANNAALMGSGGGGGGSGGYGGSSSGKKGNSALLDSASAVQDQTESGLDRIDAKIAASKDIGMKTLFELEDQRRQMGSINEDLEEFDGRVQQAASLLYRFGQGLLSDRIFQFFLLVNAVLTAVIVVVVLDKRGQL
jgi:hypothetical protein